MGRYRSRSRSYSPVRRSPSRSPPRRKRYDDPRDRYRGSTRTYRDRRSSPPSGLLIRNISLDTRTEDLRIPFEQFGPVKDVYLPKNYYTGEPRGFGFVKFRNADDAAEAKQQMNHQVLGGREITIVFAEENRKTPSEMRSMARVSGRSYRRTPPRSPRRRYRSYSRSPSPSRHEPRERVQSARDGNSEPRSRSVSPQYDDGRRHRKSHDRSPSANVNRKSSHRSPTPRSRSRSRSYSR